MGKISRLTRVFLVLAFLPSLALAYSSPGKPTGFVNDFAGVLTGDQRLQIENQLVEFQENNNAEIAVVTIKSLDGDTVENYASELFREWGIGQKGKDNGVLFLIAVEDREMRIEVGYGLEGLLTDAQTYWIQQNVVVPAFRNNDFYSGISGATQKIIAAVNQEETIPSENPAGNPSFDLESFGWLIFIVPIWLARILGRSKSWWLGGVLGGAGGLVLGLVYGFLYTGAISMILLVPVGLLFDLFVSRGYQRGKATGHFPWWIGGGRGGHGGGFGGFGGFGGGGSGGGGSSSRW
ncbi:MAG: TPM domain-containing protein [Patescibacteria group bacterium]